MRVVFENYKKSVVASTLQKNFELMLDHILLWNNVAQPPNKASLDIKIKRYCY